MFLLVMNLNKTYGYAEDKLVADRSTEKADSRPVSFLTTFAIVRNAIRIRFLTNLEVSSRAITPGGVGKIPRAPDNYGGAESLWGGQNVCWWRRKVPTKFTSTFFNTVNFLQKGLWFENEVAKLASCLGVV